MSVKKTILTISLVLGMTVSGVAQCVNIQSGGLVASDGSVIETGFDQWGYNYQAQLFNGKYCDSYRNAPWCQEYADIELMMKWNSAWLSNLDCDSDGLLDRHFGYPSYIGSGAWLTNHQSGWIEVNGKMRKWTYFVKIIAAETGDVKNNGVWFRNGGELGPVIWGEFAVIEEVVNDPSNGDHGILYKSPIGPGFGNNSQN